LALKTVPYNEVPYKEVSLNRGYRLGASSAPQPTNFYESLK